MQRVTRRSNRASIARWLALLAHLAFAVGTSAAHVYAHSGDASHAHESETHHGHGKDGPDDHHEDDDHLLANLPGSPLISSESEERAHSDLLHESAVGVRSSGATFYLAPALAAWSVQLPASGDAPSLILFHSALGSRAPPRGPDSARAPPA